MNKLIKSLFAIIFIFFNLVFSKELTYTQTEINYIKNNTVTVALLPDFHPFSFYKKRTLNGFSIDLLELIAKRSHLKFEFIADNWPTNMKKFKNGDIHIIDAISFNKERASYTNFTKAYFEIPLILYSKKNFNEYKGKLESLQNKKIGLVKNIFYSKTIENLDLFNIKYYDSTHQKLIALSNGEIDLAISGFLSGKKIIEDAKLDNLKILDEVNFLSFKREDLRFGIHKNNPILFSIFDKTYNSLDPVEINNMKNKWLGAFSKEIQSGYEGEVKLTQSEINYLNKKEIVTMCTSQNFAPIEFINEKGIVSGISIDTLKLIEKKLNYKIIFKALKTKNTQEARKSFEQKLCDIRPTTMPIMHDKHTHQYSIPYLDYKAVLITRDSEPFINSLNDIKYKGVALQNDPTIIKHIKNTYSGINIHKTSSHKESFSKVSSGEVYATISNLPMASYYITKYGFSNLKIAGHAQNNLKFTMAINSEDKLLASILNKSLSTITQREKSEIFNKWAHINFDKKFDYSLFINIAIFVSFIIILLVYRQFMLSRNNEKLQKAKDELEERNNHVKAILESTVESILITNPSDIIVECNQMCSELFGYKKEELIGMNRFDLVHKNEIKKIRQKRQKNSHTTYEVIAVNKKGILLPVLVRGSNIMKNNEVHRVSIILDLTELKKTQKALETLNKELAIKVIEEVDKNKKKDLQLLHQARHAQMGELINMIAHQWRQPLNAIAATIMNIQLQISLDKFDLDKKDEQIDFTGFLNHKLGNMEEFIQTLSVTIDDFRNFYRQDNQIKTESIHTPIKKALGIIKALILSNKIEIIQKLNSKKNIEIFESELLQVFLNIIKNAQDNFEDRQTKNPNITIITEDINNGVSIKILDNGGGIDPNIIENIFDPYFSTKNIKNGTGLGLYMSKSIIEKHHKGKLYAHNNTEGVSFYIELHDCLS